MVEHSLLRTIPTGSSILHACLSSKTMQKKTAQVISQQSLTYSSRFAVLALSIKLATRTCSSFQDVPSCQVNSNNKKDSTNFGTVREKYLL